MKYLLLLLLPFAVISCQRGITGITDPKPVIDCYMLRQGLISNDTVMIHTALGNLLNKQYSNENLMQLAASVTAGCDITASPGCFDCVKTNPPQSEMQFSFIEDDGSIASYVLDLMPAADNTIQIVGVEQ